LEDVNRVWTEKKAGVSVFEKKNTLLIPYSGGKKRVFLTISAD